MRILMVLWISFLTIASANADERFEPYIDWIVENSELEYNGEPLPTIEYASYALLEIIHYGEVTVARAEQSGHELAPVGGIYDHEQNVMMLPDTFDWDTDAHVVVHELVHYLQFVGGDVPDCLRSLEPQAYELHWQWVEETGYDAEEPNWLFVLMLAASCTSVYR